MKGGLDAAISNIQDLKAEQAKIQQAQAEMAASQVVIKKSVITSEEIGKFDSLYKAVQCAGMLTICHQSSPGFTQASRRSTS
jgi:hypothetical protein